MKKIFYSTIILGFLFVNQALSTPLSPTDDAFVVSRYNPSLNTGNFTYLETLATAVSGYVNTFLKFDLSGYTSFDSAILKLYDYDSRGSSLIRLYSVSNSWDEATLTGFNQPTWTGTPIEQTLSGVGWYSWDVTAFANTAAGGSLSLELVSIAAPTAPAQFYYSSESPNITLRPYLDVTETAPAAVPEPTTMLLLCSGLLGLGWYGRKQKKSY